MSWQREWKAIEDKITNFGIICNEYVQALSVNKSDSYGTVKNIISPMATDIKDNISVFRERYESQIPNFSAKTITDFLDKHSNFISKFTSNSSTANIPTSIMHMVSLFRKFQSDLNYSIFDLEGVVVRQTARAFSHLQRSIVADESIREKWKNAFNNNEEACERLGSVHLLLHGIWSFKVNSIGERTDLLLGEPLRDEKLSEVYLTAEGLVLTEWKKSLNHCDAAKKFSEARTQADLYVKGSMASIELKSYRYLIVVSEKAVDVPHDIQDKGIIYKHINIAVNPDTPSQVARK